jgi:hypothetical protein
MGTNTGAMMAHLAEALPMNMLMNADSRRRDEQRYAGQADVFQAGRAVDGEDQPQVRVAEERNELCREEDEHDVRRHPAIDLMMCFIRSLSFLIVHDDAVDQPGDEEEEGCRR